MLSSFNVLLLKTNIIYKCMCMDVHGVWNCSIEDLIGKLHKTFHWSKGCQVKPKKINTVHLLWFWNLLTDMCCI